MKDLPLASRLKPKVIFVDDVNMYRDMLSNIDTYQIKEIIANSYLKNWSLPVTLDGRSVNKTTTLSLDPELLPYPEIKYKGYNVIKVDVTLLDRQLIITFELGI